MAYIIETPNPFEPLTNVKKQKCEGGKYTVRSWLEAAYPGFVEFELPTICILNGKPLMREEWSRTIEHGDIVNFVTVPQGTVVLIIAIVLTIALTAVSLYISVDAAKTPGALPESDPVFTTKGQQNAIRLGEPIEACYGRNRIYPSYAARPYFRYINNDSFQFSLFCLGQGEFEIERIQIGDTDITEYQEVAYEVISPGDRVSLFPSNVYTAPEAGGQTLFAYNEPEFSADGWVGPFPANPPQTLASQIQIDLIFPKGVYSVNSGGSLIKRSVSVEAQFRRINDGGTPLEDWKLLFTRVFTWKTTTPQRISIESPVFPDRYEVRIRRIDFKDRSHRAGHDVLWEGLRSRLEVDQEFGDVTLLAVRIRATNNLNDRTQQQFNVVATRKLPIRNTSGIWSAPTATRSIVWAFVDAFRSIYGGRIDEDMFFDWDLLQELDEFYTSRNEFFDWTFRDPITVWEAAQTIARVGRGNPLLAGSLISIKRDGPLLLPVAMFGPDNIIEGTFEWSIKMWGFNEHDSISIEYTDPDTGYKQEQVSCTLPGGTNDHPQDVRIPGVQSRNHAYHEGLYMLASQRYLRENITFETGLEGHIPTYGDLIAISHDVPQWGQSGYVVEALAGAGGNYHLYVSEPLVWDETSSYQISLRGRQGNFIGPFNAQQSNDPKQVLITIPGDESGDFDFILSGTEEPMLFVFGVAGNVTKYAKVVRIEPQGGERIRITAVNDAPIIHTFDGLTAPERSSFPLIYPPDLPEVGELIITQIDGVLQIVQIAWGPAFGAQAYLIQLSDDGVVWENPVRIVRTAYQAQVRPGGLWVRVAAVNVGQGPWSEAQISVGLINGLDNHIPWDALEWGVRWWDVLNGLGFQVMVYDNSGSTPVLVRSGPLLPAERNYRYGYAELLVDGVVTREMLVEVDVLLEGEDDSTELSGAPASIQLSNTIPEAPTNLDSNLDSVDSDEAFYTLSWGVPEEGDLISIKVWLSGVMGFDPSLITPVFEEVASGPGYGMIPSSTVVSIPLESGGGHGAHYWRVGVFDVWGNEIATNVSSEQTIPTYP